MVRITDAEVGGHACTQIETIHPDRNAGSYYGYRCVLWLDKATHLPVGSETYDWPRQKFAEAISAGNVIDTWICTATSGSSDGIFAR